MLAFPFRRYFLMAAVLLPATAFAQTASSSTTDKPLVLSPTEAYRYAMQPFQDARSAPNDLTEADQWALGLGASRAHEQCEAIAPTKPQGEDLLAQGKLCVFGQDLGPAEDALVAYLGLPKMADEKTARLLLTRVFVQTNSLSAAESQLDSLTSSFPYDADLHWAIDQVIDAAWAQEGVVTRIMNQSGQAAREVPIDVSGGDLVMRLNALQLPFILKALETGGMMKTEGSTVSAAVLTRDALRCADGMRKTGKSKNAADLVDQLKTLTAVPAIAQTASKPAIDNAFARYALAGQTAPMDALHGTLVAKVPTPAVRRFAGKTTLVVVFSLGSPQFHDAIVKIAGELEKTPPKKPLQVIAVTSYAAMNGADEKTDAVLSALQALQTMLPASVPMMIVPESFLKSFAIDAFPAAIVMDAAGRIAYLDLFPGTAGSIAQVLRAASE
jgi:hypothetical protein